jgi:hypothetical protein
MVKITFIIVVVWSLVGSGALGNPNFNRFIPTGWGVGNGFDKGPYPYFQEVNIDSDSQKEIILHCSYRERDEYLPDKHMLLLLDGENGSYRKVWSRRFDSVEGVFFLARDVNKDGKKELVVHELHSGSGAYGRLWVFQIERAGLKKLFCDEVEGDTYLWDLVKQVPDLNPDYFPDSDRDGKKEIVTGHRLHPDGVSSVDEPWRFDVYKWDGKRYALAQTY